MPTGVGFSGVGLTIAGYGGVDSAPVPLQKILIDSDDGAPRESRKVDPVTGRYTLNADGQVQGMPGVEQLVLMRAKTVLHSSAVFDLGMAQPSGVVGPDILRQLREDITNAMRDIIDAGVIEVVRVEVTRPVGSSNFVRFFVWRDLTANGGDEQRSPF